MATVREIARQAGVSKTTVSLVLNNRDGVSGSMRKRVLDALNYLNTLNEARVANEMVSSAGLTSSGASSKVDSEETHLSLLLLHPPNIRSSTVFHEILRGIQAAVSLYHLQLNVALNDPDLLGDNVENLYFSNSVLRPSGVLVIGAKTEEHAVHRAHQMNLPVVLVGRDAKAYGVNGVGRDEISSAFNATQHLIEMGHRNIAFLGGSTKFSYTLERLAGYKQALDSNGFPIQEDRILLGFDEKVAANFLLNAPEITAAIFVNELFAVRVIPLLKLAGKHVPCNLSVVTFDDTEISRNFDPPLTAISYPFFQEGFWAVRVLMEQIRQPLILSCQITLGSVLVKRESCKPPRQVLQQA